MCMYSANKELQTKHLWLTYQIIDTYHININSCVTVPNQILLFVALINIWQNWIKPINIWPMQYTTIRCSQTPWCYT